MTENLIDVTMVCAVTVMIFIAILAATHGIR